MKRPAAAPLGRHGACVQLELQQAAGSSDLKTRLIDAALGCDIEAMKAAIAVGADLNEIDGGMTPLLWAILGGHFDAVKLLLESGADPNVRPSPTYCPLWSAEDDFGMTAIADLLKAYGATK